MTGISRAMPRGDAFLRTVLSLAVLAAILAVPAAAQRVPDPSDLRLDHFRCYTVLEPPAVGPIPSEVFLQDQFDVRLQRRELVRIGPPDRFCNPVAKEVAIPGRGGSTGIGDPDAHLTMYKITELAPNGVPSFFWRVLVGNQFGRQELSVREPVLLAVPTHKLQPGPHDPPQGLDHFKCYKARGRSLGLLAGLEDQFETQRVLVLDPELFCNPVRKTHPDGTATGVQNADAHLTCYDIAIPHGQFGFSAFFFILIQNQLTGSTFADLGVVTNEDLLCVPSAKLKVFGTPGSLTGGGP